MKKTYSAPGTEVLQLNLESSLLGISNTRAASASASGSDMDAPDNTQNPF